ncbi:MAG: RNA 2'-phosphotransferase [Bacilli bacterium]|nr:RNA 2'-phosphotransferase [Bacilli bacterium]
MDYIKLSKTISYVLRHHPEEYNIELDGNGFVKIDVLLDAINAKKEFQKSITIEDINYILDTSDKKRWVVVGDKIRAYYGHSFEKEIEHEEKVPPDILYHGTSHEVVDKILEEGLLPMERQFVHLSEDVETATIVGKRRDKNPIILIIDSKRAYEDGIKFMCENNHIWLTKKVDKKYIKIK